MNPDSVYIYGEPHRLESLDQVYTKPVKYSSLNSNVSGVVEIEPIRGVTFSVGQVSYNIDVVRFVEMTSTVSVRCINVPSDKVLMVYPSSVNVALKCVYPLPAKFENQPDVYVDYNDFIKSMSGKCPVRIMDMGSAVIEAVVDPVYVECRLEER